MQRMLPFLICLSLLVGLVRADPHYVDLNSTNPTSPYLSWGTAPERNGPWHHRQEKRCE
ncbi:hypothetical protein ACFLSJ_01510 [Verrucomicrobiota bacterium]